MPDDEYCCDDCQRADSKGHIEDPRVIDSEFIDDKYQWSLETFGTAQRAEGIVADIRSELLEVLAKPDDITQWVDVILLALDGMSRQGFSGEEIINAIIAKQKINTTRKWSVTKPEADQPTFHIKDDNGK